MPKIRDFFPSPTEAVDRSIEQACLIQALHEVGLDPETGELVFSSRNGNDEFRGGVGDLAAREDFWIRDFKDADLPEVAFMMGYLCARLEILKQGGGDV